MNIKKFNDFIQEKKLMKLSDEDREKESAKKEGDGYVLTIVTKEAEEKAKKDNKKTSVAHIGNTSKPIIKKNWKSLKINTKKVKNTMVKLFLK